MPRAFHEPLPPQARHPASSRKATKSEVPGSAIDLGILADGVSLKGGSGVVQAASLRCGLEAAFFLNVQGVSIRLARLLTRCPAKLPTLFGISVCSLVWTRFARRQSRAERRAEGSRIQGDVVAPGRLRGVGTSCTFAPHNERIGTAGASPCGSLSSLEDWPSSRASAGWSICRFRSFPITRR